MEFATIISCIASISSSSVSVEFGADLRVVVAAPF